MHTSVVNLGTSTLSLAGVVALAPGRPATINIDGLHIGIRSYVESSLNSSERGGLVEILATGTKEECDKAGDVFLVDAANPIMAAAVSAPAVAVAAAKVEAAILPGVFAAGKGKVTEATLRPALAQTPTEPDAPAPISAPAPAPDVVDAAAPAPAPDVAPTPDLSSLAGQGKLLAAVKAKVAR